MTQAPRYAGVRAMLGQLGLKFLAGNSGRAKNKMVIGDLTVDPCMAPMIQLLGQCSKCHLLASLT